MIKKLSIIFLVLVIGSVFVGCAKVAEQQASSGGGGTGTAATLPAGTTQCKLSASNLAFSGTGNSGLAFSLSALNQNNAAISGLGTGNFTSGKIYTANPTIVDVTAATTQTAVATLTFTAISGGGSGTAKDVSAALGKLFVSLEAAASANNKAAVVLFDEHVSLECPMLPTAANLATIDNAITKESGYGGATALYYAIANGIWEASKEAASSTRVRAVVALTDGGENSSPSPYSGIAAGTVEVVNQAVAASIPVYTVGLFETTAEADTYSPYLKSIAKGTTGSEDNYFEVIIGVTGLSAKDAQAHAIRQLGALTNLYQNLATAITQSYTLTSAVTYQTNLTSGQTYYLEIVFQAPVSGGTTITNTLVVPFVAP